jgi:hypothetical protein
VVPYLALELLKDLQSCVRMNNERRETTKGQSSKRRSMEKIERMICLGHSKARLEEIGGGCVRAREGEA